MKKITTLIFICLIHLGICVNAVEVRQSYPSQDETQINGVPVVSKYLELSIKEWTTDVNTHKERMQLLSQEWAKSKDVDYDLLKLNDFGFEEFKILGVTDQYVTAKGFNRTNNWARVIKFRIIFENGSYLIEPSHITEGVGRIVPATRYLTAYWTAGELLK